MVGRDSPGWVSLHRVPSFVYGAFVSAEDGRFFEHHGFDTTQIAKSFEIDLRDRRLARGGSTISQQLIKNSFLTQRRSLDRKIQEAILTWRLESRLDKKTILERYLNVIELGPHTFGIRAAAQHWFGASPRELSVHQAAFLAALTSEPQSMSRRVRRAGALDPDSAARVDIILYAMRRDGVIDNEQFDHARASQLWFSPAALARDD
jgi:membrane peptidoglycan carboxypeptidase